MSLDSFSSTTRVIMGSVCSVCESVMCAIEAPTDCTTLIFGNCSKTLFFGFQQMIKSTASGSFTSGYTSMVAAGNFSVSAFFQGATFLFSKMHKILIFTSFLRTPLSSAFFPRVRAFYATIFSIAKNIRILERRKRLPNAHSNPFSKALQPLEPVLFLHLLFLTVLNVK